MSTNTKPVHHIPMVTNKKASIGAKAKASIVVGFLIAGLIIWYLGANREHQQLNDNSRAALGGTYITLSDGITHYELSGDETDLPVVLLHGATIPSWDWDPQMQFLVDGGFRVLRYDMFGRGWSDRPPITYDRALYRRQLSELVDKLNIAEPFALVGHSFGGAVAVDFAAHSPERVNNLVLISPVVNSVESRAPFIASSIPILGRFLMRTIIVNTVRARARSLYKTTKLPLERYDALFRKQISFEGFENALYSMFKTDAIGDYRESYSKVSAAQIPVTLLWGTQDKDITKEAINEAKAAIPHMKVIVLDKVGHSPNLQTPVKTNKILVNSLK